MKRVISLFLTLIMVVGVLTNLVMFVTAASFTDINANNVFIKQQPNTSTCTLCAATNMMRRLSMLRGDSNWSSITESSARSSAWISGTGLRGTFNYSDSSNGIANISVTCKTLPGNSSNTSTLINLLASHPEGIVIYNGIHAVLLTDYTGGVFYCNDPDDEQPVGRVPASRAYSVKPENATKYWYVSSPSVTLTSGPSGEMTTPIISLSRDIYYVGDKVNITWAATSSNTDFYQYWLIITNTSTNKDCYVGSAGSDGNPAKNSYTFSISESGSYKITVYAVPHNNKDSRQKIATKTFVANTTEMTTPTISTSKDCYCLGENVSISWKTTSSNSDFYQYWLIIKNLTTNKDIYAGSAGSDGNTNKNTYNFNATNEGEYYITVYAVPYFNKDYRQKVATKRIEVITNKFSITFNANGGTCSTTSKTVTYGSTYGTLPTPTRSGYTFAGWYTATSGGTKVTSSTAFTSTSNQTLYARWTTNACTVTFNANGGTCSTTSKTVTYGSTYGTLPTPTRTGYTFDEWYTATTNGTKVTSSTKVTTASNHTLYAVWNPNIYVVTLDAKGGTCNTAIIMVTYESVYKTLPTPTRSGYIFKGWYTAATGGNKVTETTVFKVAGEQTLYAQWEAIKPATPTVTIANAATGVKVSWNKITGASKYYVYRKASGEKSWTRLTDSATGTSYTDTKAKSGTTYYYTVKAVSGSVASASKSSSALKYLAMPKVSSLSNENSGITVKWNKITGASGYYVYRKTSSGSWSLIYTVKSGSTVSYTDKSAKAGTTYYYTVRAYSGSVKSTYTSSSAVRRLTTPTLKSVSSAKSGITFKWNKVTGASGYYVYRKTGSGSWQKIATIKSGSTVSYLDKTAKKGTTYTYTVKAYYSSNVSAYNTTGLKIKDKY